MDPSSHKPSTQAFVKAYDDYADALFRHCFFRVYDREKARDVLQECFTRTWAYIAEGHEVTNLRSFLYRVANNLIIDAARKRKESSLEEMAEAGFQPSVYDEDCMIDRMDGRRIMEHLHLLEEKHRDVLVMRFVDGFGPKEIGEILGETENVISVRIHRAVKTLRLRCIEKGVIILPT